MKVEKKLIHRRLPCLEFKIMNQIFSENDILKIGIKAKEASRKVSTLETNLKNEIICSAAENLMKNKI